MSSHKPDADSHRPLADPIASPIANVTVDEVTQLAHDIASGQVRPTVADIRRHRGCSQSRAATLRRQLADLNVTA